MGDAALLPVPTKPPKPHKLASVLSGSISGAVISSCVQPLDVLRTRIQGDAAQGVSRTTLETLRLVLKQDGLRGLWRGTTPTVVRLSFGAGLHFLFLDSIRNMLEKQRPDGKLSRADTFFMGGLARAGSAVIMCPITVIKTRMEYGGSGGIQYRNVAHAFTSIARTEKLPGLFRGLGPTLITNAPFSALYYLFYKELQTRLSGDGKPSTVVNLASGTMAAVAASLLTQPTDVIRTRMQLGLADRKLGATAVMRSVLARDGASGLLAGVAPRILKRTLQTALVWTLYEELAPRLSKLGERAAAEVRRRETDRKASST